MAINRTGFEQSNTGISIDKDTQGQMTYTFDWTEWLGADTISTVAYSVAARRNDPAAMVIETSGKTDTSTYVELSGGAEGKVYIVTALVNTTNGIIDRRNFRVNVVSRSA
jgi:hypothetical protein|tara:strand:+ start:245 stop:574 length:330 start_codon:yes stop_codon:yes gene_type:complete